VPQLDKLVQELTNQFGRACATLNCLAYQLST